VTTMLWIVVTVLVGTAIFETLRDRLGR